MNKMAVTKMSELVCMMDDALLLTGRALHCTCHDLNIAFITSFL